MTIRSSIVLVLLTVSVCPIPSASGSPGNHSAQAPRTTDTVAVYRPFLINSVFNYYGNNGDGSFNRFSTNNEGFEFLKGSGKTLIFEDGLIWGGFHKGRSSPKVGGSMYRHALQAGPIVQYGNPTTDPVADDPTTPANRIYRVRPDIGPRTPPDAARSLLEAEEIPLISRYETYTADQLYAQYVADWNAWPAGLGAPFTYGTDAAGIRRTAPLPYDPLYDTPGQPGAGQTLWFVSNDCNGSLDSSFAGSPVIGLEIQRTIWGYHSPGALDQAIFISTLIINKSGAPIDSMYLGLWSDPDVGDGGDDFAGCDTARDLGYMYNGRPVDAVYGSAVPAVGFTLLQGPIVPAGPDTATFRLHHRVGFANLRMSGFEFEYPTSYFGGPLGPEDVQLYRLMQALIPASGSPLISPITQQPTKFMVPGDPVTGSGWIDGQYGLTPQDRRMTIDMGPFTMAPGDTQEVVVAALAGVGPDRLSSITVLRAATDRIRSSFRNLLAVPAPPPPPTVLTAALDREIILTWGDSASVARTEGTTSQGYGFEGYKIYEYQDLTGTNPILLGTYDLEDGIKTIIDTVYDQPTGFFLTSILQRGTDSGIIRSLDITGSRITGLPLSNGSKYFFGVTAYNYNANPVATLGTHSLESPAHIQAVVPQSTNPGSRFHQSQGDAIPVTLSVTPGIPPPDGQVTPVVVDPTRITGDTYAVVFSEDTAGRKITWGVKDVTKNTSLVSQLSNLSGGNAYPIVDGVQVKVIAPPPGMKTGDQYTDPADTAKWGWYIPSGVRRWTPSGSDIGNLWHLEGFSRGGLYNGAIGNAFDHWFSGGVTYDRLTNVLLKFAATDSTWDPTATPRDSNFSRGYRYVRHATDTSTFAAHPGWSAFIPRRTGGYAYQDYNYGIPFSAWNVETKPPVRLAVGHIENNAMGGMVDGKWWPPSSSMAGVDNGGTQREWWFIFGAPYTDPAPNPALTVDIQSTPTPMMWLGMPDRAADAYSAGDQFMILTNHAFGPADTFTFTPVAPTVGDLSAARADVTKINVFPNPYKSFDPADPTRFTQVVTFTHLPQRAIIRIFTLAGILVKSFLKDDPGQFASWNLQNSAGKPVASGVYIVHIQMPDLGSTKTLKLGILAETY